MADERFYPPSDSDDKKWRFPDDDRLSLLLKKYPNKTNPEILKLLYEGDDNG